MVILPSKAAASPTKKKLASRSVHHRPSLLSCGVRASCLPMVLKRCCSAHYFSGTMHAHRHAHQHALVVRQLTNYWWLNVLGPFFPVQQTKQKTNRLLRGRSPPPLRPHPPHRERGQEQEVQMRGAGTAAHQKHRLHDRYVSAPCVLN